MPRCFLAVSPLENSIEILVGRCESPETALAFRADVDEGRVDGLTRYERAELVRLRRESRVQAMEIEIQRVGGPR